MKLRISMARAFTACVLFALLIASAASAGPYAPAAGQSGSTAIYRTDTCFVGWATACTVSRGYVNASDPSKGYASYGTEAEALGAAGDSTTAVVSLGDGGSATLTFDTMIGDGDGFDFAVFENGFSDTFLELGFVEVSSNGSDFFRFPSVSLTDATTQVGGFGSVDTTNIYDLAGKYRIGYGTPFDLAELAGVSPLLNVNAVSCVRVVDVVGCVQDACCTYDSLGNKVNDPWPTAFSSCGFDLDAVGVIHTGVVPEPSSLLALLTGAVGLVGFVARRRA